MGEELGGRRGGGEGQSRHLRWRNSGFQAYADYMDSAGFRSGLRHLENEARSGLELAIMCAETLWWRCHRRLIADALVLRGVEVVHLIDESHSSGHVLHDSVRRDEDGWPVYDVGVSGRLDTETHTKKPTAR
jgi:uncharacterized protein (DUF488 family)